MSQNGRECLSPYAVEKAVADRGWPSALKDEQRAHLAVCPECAARVQRAWAAESEFRSGVMPRGLPELEERLLSHRRGRFLVWGFSGVVVAATAVAVCLALPGLWTAGGRYTGPSGMGGDEKSEERSAAGVTGKPNGPGGNGDATSTAYTGLKAACSLVLYVKRGREVFRHDGTEPLKPGDAVRIVPVAPGRSWMLLFHHDASGTLQMVYPWNGEESGPLPPPGEAVDGAFELDGKPGNEEWVAVYSDVPIAASPLAERLRVASFRQTGRRVVDGAELDVVRARYTKVMP